MSPTQLVGIEVCCIYVSTTKFELSSIQILVSVFFFIIEKIYLVPPMHTLMVNWRIQGKYDFFGRKKRRKKLLLI